MFAACGTFSLALWGNQQQVSKYILSDPDMPVDVAALQPHNAFAPSSSWTKWVGVAPCGFGLLGYPLR